MQKNAFYFSHDANARNDEKILMLRAEHGIAGYGVYWTLVEMMFEDNDTRLSHARLRGIAVSCSIDIAVLSSVISTAIAENLFVSDGYFFWSESLRKRKHKIVEGREKKSKAGKMGSDKRWAKSEDDSDAIAEVSSAIAKHSKVKEIKGDESKENIKNHSDDFVKFWEKYPSKTGKAAAEKSFKKAMVKVDLEIMLEALDTYRKSEKVKGGIICNPSTWLNQERWRDEGEATPEDKWLADGPNDEMLSEWDAKVLEMEATNGGNLFDNNK